MCEQVKHYFYAGLRMNDTELMSRLRLAIAAAGSQTEFARRAGVSTSYVSDVIRGRRAPGASLLKALGLERTVGYRRVR